MRFSYSGLKTLLSLKTSAWARTSADSNAAQPHDLQDSFHYLHRAHIARLQSMIRLSSAYASAIHRLQLLILQGNSCCSTLAHPTLFVTMAHTRSHKVPPAATSCLWHQLGTPMQGAPLRHTAQKPRGNQCPGLTLSRMRSCSEDGAAVITVATMANLAARLSATRRKELDPSARRHSRSA